MCRLLGFVSNSAVTIQDLGGSDLADFIKLSEFHKDSWGLALIDGENSLLEKRVESAASSPSFTQVLTDRFAKGGLLHFRWASPGIEVTDENAHPFTHGDIAFIHNGSLKPYDTLISEIPESFLALRKGTGDSELFFLMSLAHIESEGFVAGVLKTVRKIKMNHSFSSINSMFLNSDYLVVVAEHHPEKNRNGRVHVRVTHRECGAHMSDEVVECGERDDRADEHEVQHGETASQTRHGDILARHQ